ncbi:GNAT family N-acetyltransferase [Marinicella sediminis]|uniref:GNAT family N-acetyltransferase n=1 Tax=Marinicella sediminis TaxID=1792834 RepID=A0ABV7JA87_9GAMM|nr:GNAT family N-acetyltransferase [Marinicella sediminis]
MTEFIRKSWQALTTDEVYQLLRLRSAVFVVEQNCAYQDMDGLDQLAEHLFCTDDQQHLTGYARLLPPGSEGGSHCSIGRVVVDPSKRQQQLGRQLMQTALAHCDQLWPHVPVLISAQTYLTRFYQALGFVNTGDYYLEDMIPHQKMIHQKNQPAE